MKHVRWLAGAAIAAAACVGVARAATEAKFDPASFAAAQRAGKPILVDISAPWCPTCARQRPILARLESQPDYAGLQVFHVDFDSQKAAVRQMGAQMQSTLIVFHGATEEGRSTGDTDAASIAALLARSKE